MKKFSLGFLSVSLVLFFIMTSVRILFNPFYLTWEYNRSYFPPDSFGFTTNDRYHWGKISMEYITRGVDISYLANQTLDDGQPLYNDRELSHMVDVQKVFLGMVSAWKGMGIVYLGLLLWAWKKNWLVDFVRAVSTSGWITLATIALILVGVAVSFYQLFTVFHKLFFTGDSWLFQWSDTLIRLFPLEFWRDAFIWMGFFTVIFGLTAGFGGRWLVKKVGKG